MSGSATVSMNDQSGRSHITLYFISVWIWDNSDQFPVSPTHRLDFPNSLEDARGIRSLLPPSQVTLPSFDTVDMLMWSHTPNGELPLKEAYKFKDHNTSKLSWTKYVWNRDVPPAKSIMVWRLMLDKFPTDDKLAQRGFNMPSMCFLCHRNAESSFHLFFDCVYSCNIWCWLSTMLNMPLHFQSIEEIWKTSDRYSNLQSKLVVNSAIINLLNSIWFARNQVRFNNKKIPWKCSIASIIVFVSLAGNISKTTSLSMTDFTLLKKFDITLHPPRAPRITEVLWQPPITP